MLKYLKENIAMRKKSNIERKVYRFKIFPDIRQ